MYLFKRQMSRREISGVSQGSPTGLCRKPLGKIWGHLAVLKNEACGKIPLNSHPLSVLMSRLDVLAKERELCVLETMNLSSQNCSEEPRSHREESTARGFFRAKVFRVFSREEASVPSAEWPGALSASPESVSMGTLFWIANSSGPRGSLGLSHSELPPYRSFLGTSKPFSVEKKSVGRKQ